MKKTNLTITGCMTALKKSGGKFFCPDPNLGKIFAIMPKVGIKQLGLVDFMRGNKKRGGVEVVEVIEGSPLHQRLAHYQI